MVSLAVPCEVWFVEVAVVWVHVCVLWLFDVLVLCVGIPKVCASEVSLVLSLELEPKDCALGRVCASGVSAAVGSAEEALVPVSLVCLVTVGLLSNDV